MAITDRRSLALIWAYALFACLLATLCAAGPQGGGVTWGSGNSAGAGSWSNAGAAAGPNMHPPGSLGSTDPQFSYGYAGVDSRGPYGGSGGNGGFYVGGTDEHGRPYSYNGGAGNQPMPGQVGQPGYNNYYGYGRSGASMTAASLGVALALSLLATRT